MSMSNGILGVEFRLRLVQKSSQMVHRQAWFACISYNFNLGYDGIGMGTNNSNITNSRRAVPLARTVAALALWLLPVSVSFGHGISESDKQSMLKWGVSEVHSAGRIAHTDRLRPSAVSVRRDLFSDAIQRHRQIYHGIHAGPMYYADLRDIHGNHHEIVSDRCGHCIDGVL